MKNWQKTRIDTSKKFQEAAYEQVNELIFKKRDGKCLILSDNTKLIEFVSCSYLGLDMDKRIIRASNNNINNCGVTFPAARTRIQAKSFVILEKLLNNIFCNSFTTIFSTLHLGHLGLIPILGSGTLPSFPSGETGFQFILDKTVHSSIQINRALMEQFGEVSLVSFNCNKKIEVEFKEAINKGKKPIAIADSIGSMGGITPIKFLFELAEKHDGYIYLDDAHGTSIFGKHGCGYVLQKLNNQFHPRLILASSLSKAFGAVAGVISLPTKKDADFLKHFSPTYIFGGPPSLAIIDSAIESAHIHLSEEIYTLQNKLWDNVKLFDYLLKQHIINNSSPSPIRGVLIGDEFKTIKITKELKKIGFAVTAALYPTVPKNRAMLRIAISAIHTKEQITAICKSIMTLIKKPLTSHVKSFTLTDTK